MGRVVEREREGEGRIDTVRQPEVEDKPVNVENGGVVEGMVMEDVEG